MDERDVTEALESQIGERGVDAEVLNDALPVAVLVIDTVGTIRFANQRLASLTGIGVDQYVGSSVFDLVDVAISTSSCRRSPTPPTTTTS